MTKGGDAIALTLNGVKFSIPKDVTPTVIDSGIKNTSSEHYGDGTADTIQSVVQGKIKGLKVKIDPAQIDQWKAVCSAVDIPIIYECIACSYEMTGSVIGAEVEIDTTKNQSNEFEVHCTDGSGLRRSM